MEPHFANDVWAERENRMTRFPLIASQYLSNLLAKMQDLIIYTTSSNILYFHHDIWERTLEARAGIAYNSSQEYPVHGLRSSIMFKVRAKYLLLIAAAVWFLAGVNIMRLGIIACLEGDVAIWLLVIGIPVVFVVFHCMFSKLVGKHADRIRGYGEDKMHVLRFFDVKGYVIMAIMMGGGISLRAFGIVPGWFVAFFYTGLGTALALAGIGFLVNYIKRGFVNPGPDTMNTRLALFAMFCDLWAPRPARARETSRTCYVLRPMAAVICQGPRNFPSGALLGPNGRTCTSRASR